MNSNDYKGLTDSQLGDTAAVLGKNTTGKNATAENGRNITGKNTTGKKTTVFCYGRYSTKFLAKTLRQSFFAIAYPSTGFEAALAS